MASHQPTWAPAQSTAVLGFAAMAAVGATGLAAQPASAVDGSARGTTLVAQEHDRAEPAVAAPATDPGLALADRIRAQAVQQRATAEDAARRQAAQLAAAKLAMAQQIAADDQARAQAADERAAEARAAEAHAAALRAAEAEAAQAAQAQAQAAQVQAQAAQAQAAAQAQQWAGQAQAAPFAGSATATATPARTAVGTLVAPVAGAVRGDGFGQSDSYWAHLHTGQDFAAPTGTPVVAVGEGVITSAGWAGAYGYRVVQTLPDGTELWYCHLSAIGVGAGQVTAGQPIARVGATGSNVSAPHLHLEVRPSGGEPVDPSSWLSAHGLAL
ncbi:M23 family metallopeptidase [Streptacidiphilus cavernicola]|uniref:M23 family metallopeptidase n=1 Tax=Streptacidiphilus cavernicola TaxID=3342716 RepID=A0ABV6VXV9_9ACTN